MKYIGTWVVIPAFNEERLIASTLESLVQQSDNAFTVLVVDNGSSDATTETVTSFSRKYPEFSITVITELQKGTGAACDTGFRHAIDHGATFIARIDSDALAHKDWIKTIHHYQRSSKKLVAGRLHHRTDEANYRWYDGILLPLTIRFAETVAKFWHNDPKQYNYPMFMVSGLNMAIEPELYIRVDGFPRSSIDTTDEDKEIHLKIRRVATKNEVVFAPDMIVYGSIRRVKSYGYIGILLWYWDRRHKAKVVDIR